MSDHPAAAVVAREARGIQAELKALLARDVWGNYRDADFQRKNLRRRYLNLLLLHPGTREARDAGTHLWMQTSYAFIALYKQRLSRAAHSNNHNNSNGNNPTNGNNKGGGSSGVVETRKLLQRFRQFLADEERFWRALVLRVQRAFGVSLPSSVSLPPELVGGAGGEDEGAPQDRMNHFGFPSAAVPAGTADGREGDAGVKIDAVQARSILSKALVCLGDIARYREQYKAPPSLPKTAANVSGEKKRLYEPRPNYTRPRALYLAAHALAPGEGNAAHQLAILAGYESDTLAAVAWYLRALCVRAPFETARENLAGVLARVLANPHVRPPFAKPGAATEGAADDKDEDEREPPRVRIERFKRDVVLLHALWHEGSAPPQQTLALSARVARAFARLVSARALPEEFIVRVGVLAQGAVWGRRRSRHTSAPSAPAPPTTVPGAARRPLRALQAAQLAHLLALHTALLGAGVRELVEVDTARAQAQGGALAERISAELRRALPALRVGSKWVLGNWGWVLAAGNNKAREAMGWNAGEEEEEEEAELRAQLERFWGTYAEFLRRLVRTFPLAQLPALSEGAEGGEKGGSVEFELELEEDLDMRGWLPLRGFMGGDNVAAKGDEVADTDADTDKRDRRTVGGEEVHPNVEQLMRIADLLRDGRRIVGLEGSPLALYGGQFVVKGVEAVVPAALVGGVSVGFVPHATPAAPAPAAAEKLASIRDLRLAMHGLEEDAMTEKTSRTDDDILHDAFSFLNQEGSEPLGSDDEDEIVWDLREAPVAVSPIIPTARTSPKTPVRLPPIGPIGPPSRGAPTTPAAALPFHAPPPQQPITPGTQVPATTALDLLHSFSMPKAPITKPLHVGAALGEGESLLFGSRSTQARSIWSASRDEHGFMFPGGAGAGAGGS
ncbi:hypothetical protein FB451DRAFT_1083325, partial [Mycena latifolia]